MAGSVDDDLAHYGVKGMRWGFRKDEPLGEVVLTKKCKNGTELTISKTGPTGLAKLIEKGNPKLLEGVHTFKLTNKEGQKVGQASFYQESPTKLQLEWIGVNRGHRRNGYARAALEGVIKYAKDNGVNELELVATSMGRPLYESLGFERAPGGVHILRIEEAIKHAATLPDLEKLAYYIVMEIDATPENELDEELAMSDGVDRVLAHYGVKGMRWGVRRNADGSTSRTGKRTKSEDYLESREIKKKHVSEMSNQELRKINERLQLEKTYSQLKTTDGFTIKKGQSIAKDIISVAKTANEMYNLASTPAAKAGRDVLREALKN